MFRRLVPALLATASLTMSGAVPATPAKIVSPMTAQEIHDGVQAGLGCDFSVAKRTYFIIVMGEALLKIGATTHHLRMSDERSLAMINDGGVVGDSTVRIIIDRDEKPVAEGEESTVRTARMTVRFKGAEQTLSGRWTCGA